MVPLQANRWSLQMFPLLATNRDNVIYSNYAFISLQLQIAGNICFLVAHDKCMSVSSYCDVVSEILVIRTDKYRQWITGTILPRNAKEIIMYNKSRLNVCHFQLISRTLESSKLIFTKIQISNNICHECITITLQMFMQNVYVIIKYYPAFAYFINFE